MTKFQVSQTALPPGFIDLGLGDPDPALLPVELVRRSADTYFAAPDRESLQYGHERGDGRFRQALADFLASMYGNPVHPEALIVTNGVSSALDLICTLYTSPGDVILVEEPSYHLALRIFRDHQLLVTSVPGDFDGSFLENLERRLDELKPKMLYIIPTFQNPGGRTMPQDQRRTLITLARQHQVLLIADEVYHFLAYSLTPPPPFAAVVDHEEQVISVSSFSKILAPGLRLGWVQAHEKVLQRLAGSGMLDSGGGMNPFTSALVRDLIENGGLVKNILHLRQEYSLRLEAMAKALRRFLPEAAREIPAGGFFFWVRIPGVDAAELRARASRFNVGLRQGTLFSSCNGLEEYFRLGFCYYSPSEIEEGIRRIRECFHGYGSS